MSESRDNLDLSGSWQDAEQALLEFGLKATPAQRFAWLEEALALSYRSGAIQMTAAIEKKNTP